MKLISEQMKKLHIHYFQHVSHEGPGNIEDWAFSSRHTLTSTRFYENAQLPELSGIDWLIVMGGPMSANDDNQFPWLTAEKEFIKQAISAGKMVLGICLGSQLISAALGAKVYRNPEKEIGWFDIELNTSGRFSLFKDIGPRLKVFHWHGDTFDLPEGAVHLASSEGCRNQAYSYKDNVLALQFHLEPTMKLLKEMVEAGRSEITSGKYVQTEDEIVKSFPLIEQNTKIMSLLLDRLSQR